MKALNERYDYGLDLFLLSIDEGITGYRDDSLEVHLPPSPSLSLCFSHSRGAQTVKRNRDQYGIPLKILSYDELYGWTMDRVVETVGRKNNCTFCGVFRRQALDRGAAALGVDHIVTGHNADDIAETVLMNSAFISSPFWIRVLYGLGRGLGRVGSGAASAGAVAFRLRGEWILGRRCVWDLCWR